MTEVRLSFVVRVLDIYWQNDCQEDLFWRVDDGVLSLYAMCSDVFHWGTADLEQITPENVHELEQAITDVKAIDKDEADEGFRLFCARVRMMRPQGAVYKYIPVSLWPLFNACGPKRETDLFNPHKHPEDEEEVSDES